MSSDADLVFNSVKEYPDMIKIIIYREPFKAGGGKSVRRARRKNPESSKSSISRTKTTIADICLCNKFDLFCTFTFDPKRFNSKSMSSCKAYMNNWCHNAKARHSRQLEYLIVPEHHKSGAIHFHALIKGYCGRLKDSGHKQGGRIIYNIPHWHFGFSTAVKIDNIEAVSRYIRKYITKDMILFPGSKRYYCSQGLIRPSHSCNVPDVVPFLRSVKYEFFANRDAEFYTIFKKDLDAIHQQMLQ